MNGEQTTTAARGAEQARLELSVAASAAERANRPRHFVFIATAVLAAATVYMLLGLLSLRSASAATGTERSQTERLRGLINDLAAVETAEASRIHAPDPGIGAELERLMEEVGLTRVQVGVLDNVSQSGKAVQRTYSASFKDQDAGAVLTWLSRTKTEPRLVGIEIWQVSVSPGKPTPAAQPGWNVDVRLTRWERK